MRETYAIDSHALSEALASKDSESTSHVGKHPCTMLVVIGKERDARQANSLRNGLQRSFLFHLALILPACLLGLWRGDDFGRDSRGCHCVEAVQGNRCDMLSDERIERVD
jgi:hypothetical protein